MGGGGNFRGAQRKKSSPKKKSGDILVLDMRRVWDEKLTQSFSYLLHMFVVIY